MEFIRKNIHMDRISAKGSSQIALEDDMNIPENKPDLESLCLEKGTVLVDEVIPGQNQVLVRGKILVSLLYYSAEAEKRLVAMEGKLSFAEKIHVQGMDAGKTAVVTGETEDLSITIINSRKLSARAVLYLEAKVQDLCDVSVPVGLQTEEKMEYQKFPLSFSELSVCKNDIYRVKEECSLPAGYPNLYQILWSSVTLGDMEFRPMNDKITIQGDIHLSILYEGEGEMHQVHSFQTILPLEAALDCLGCSEDCVADIQYAPGQKEISIHPDLDGEERCIGLEMPLELQIRLYEEAQVELLADVYGVGKDIVTETASEQFKKVYTHITGKTKVTEHVKPDPSAGKVLQVITGEAVLNPATVKKEDHGLDISGFVKVKALYLTDNDGVPYRTVEKNVPYQYRLETAGMYAEDDMAADWKETKQPETGDCEVQARVEALQFGMIDSDEIEMKVILSFATMIKQEFSGEVMQKAEACEIDPERKRNLPGMVIYVVRKGDSLWSIGKKYYVTVEMIKQLNGLSDDLIYPGQKLLLMKEQGGLC